MTTQAASHDHTTAYLVLASVIMLALAIAAVWFYAS